MVLRFVKLRQGFVGFMKEFYFGKCGSGSCVISVATANVVYGNCRRMAYVATASVVMAIVVKAIVLMACVAMATVVQSYSLGKPAI